MTFPPIINMLYLLNTGDIIGFCLYFEICYSAYGII